jgi:hypothetical protein
VEPSANCRLIPTYFSAFAVDRLDKCRIAFQKFKEIHGGGLLKDVKCIYYDLASILFSLSILKNINKVSC